MSPTPLTSQTPGTVLFDQQFWCWGQDVRREGGNALLLYGLERDACLLTDEEASWGERVWRAFPDPLPDFSLMLQGEPN